MLHRFSALCVVSLLLTSLAFAKDKKSKTPLPADVLHAQTVIVLIDPNAGMSAVNPNANAMAQHDVETAFEDWGKYRIALSMADADLIVVVRKGTGHKVNETIPNPAQNGRPGIADGTDSAVVIGMQKGRPANPNGQTGGGSQSPHLQTEVSSADDSFLVYRGNVEDPLSAVPMWRLNAKDCLHRKSVPAVDEFKAAVAETERVIAEQQQKKP